MNDKPYTVKSAHQVGSFQLGHSKDGKFLSLTFSLPSGEMMTIAIPFNVQHEFIEDVGREFKECERRIRRRNDYADLPGNYPHW